MRNLQTLSIVAILSIACFSQITSAQGFPFGNAAVRNGNGNDLVLAALLNNGNQNIQGLIAGQAAFGQPINYADFLANLRLKEASAARMFGDARQSHAEAWLIEIEARKEELRYHLEHIQTYMDARRMNKEWRRENNPLPHERFRKAEELHLKNLRELPHFSINHLSLANEMNFMLKHLTTRLVAKELLNSSDVFGGQEFAGRIPTSELSKIRLRSSVKIDGNYQTYSLAEQSIIERPLPAFFENPDLDAEAKSYDAARIRFIDDVRDRIVTIKYTDYDRLYHPLRELEDAFKESYRPAESTEYFIGKRFFDSQRAAIIYAQREGDTRFLVGSQIFEGETFSDLLNYMNQNGLEFDNHSPADKPVYVKLFLVMRQALGNF